MTITTENIEGFTFVTIHRTPEELAEIMAELSATEISNNEDNQ